MKEKREKGSKESGVKNQEGKASCEDKGKKSLKVWDAVGAYRMLNTAKLTQMQSDERIAFIRAMREIKKVATDFDEFLNDARTRLKPEGGDAIAQKIQEEKALTADEQSAWEKYEREVNSCVMPEMNKEVEFGFEALGVEAIERLACGNDFVMADISFLEKILG